MSYTLPQNVTAPEPRLKNLNVLYDDGEGSFAVAEFAWDGEPNCIGIRWNGNTRHPEGNPVSSSNPVWLVVPEPFTSPIRAIAAALGEVRRRG